MILTEAQIKEIAKKIVMEADDIIAEELMSSDDELEDIDQAVENHNLIIKEVINTLKLGTEKS